MANNQVKMQPFEPYARRLEWCLGIYLKARSAEPYVMGSVCLTECLNGSGTVSGNVKERVSNKTTNVN